MSQTLFAPDFYELSSLPAAETITNVLDFKREAGLWHGVLTVSQLKLIGWLYNQKVKRSVLSLLITSLIYLSSQ